MNLRDVGSETSVTDTVQTNNFSNLTTDADEACRSSEISVDFIIIIVFL